MCGFVGIACPGSERVVRREELAEMLAPIAHRGPDDEAFVEDREIGLGFRRLSILDVEHGRQPMRTRDGRWTVVHNGEIYDHLALRRELEGLGHTFRTRSDAEVVLEAFAAWGERSVERLRGIFAIAAWDSAERTLYLARDRSGIKPLHYRVARGEIVFGSEAKALLARRDTPRALDVLSLFAPPDIDADIEPSPFVGIAQVGAGTTLAFGVDAKPRSRRYWSYAPAEEPPGDADTLGEDGDALVIARLREELASVVEMQLMSDVPLGACLSGGLDSSLITALAAERSPSLSTFTTVTEGSLDAWNAFALARAKGLSSRSLAFDPARSVDLVERVAWGAEGVFDWGFVSRFELASFARSEGVRVLLAGQGVDELVGGYDESAARMRRAAKRAVAAERLVHAREAVVESMLAAPEDDPSSAREVALHLRRQHASLSHLLLRFEDRMGMLAGVEIRVPFLDHAIVELTARVSPRARARLFGDKRIVREAARGLLPETVRARRKFALNGNLPSLTSVLARTHFAHLVDDATVRDKGYFDPARVRHLRDTGDERALDAVLVTHLLDELFVARFDASRFAQASPPEVREVTVDASWMPAESLIAAHRGPRAADVPSRNRELAFVGPLAHVGPSASGTASELLGLRTTRGEDVLLPLPEGVSAARAAAFLCALDGASSYADLATTLRITVDESLDLGSFFVSLAWVEHRGRA